MTLAEEFRSRNFSMCYFQLSCDKTDHPDIGIYGQWYALTSIPPRRKFFIKTLGDGRSNTVSGIPSLRLSLSQYERENQSRGYWLGTKDD